MAKLKRVAVSLNHDFIVEARRRQRNGTTFARVIYVPQKTPVGTWVDELEPLAKAGDPSDFADALLLLPLS